MRSPTSYLLHIYQLIYLSIFLPSIYLPIHKSIYLYIYVSIYLPINLSSIYLSFCLFRWVLGLVLLIVYTFVKFYLLKPNHIPRKIHLEALNTKEKLKKKIQKKFIVIIFYICVFLSKYIA